MQYPRGHCGYTDVHCRVVAPGSGKTIGPHTFANWGAHHDSYPCAYFTAAAAIGMRKEEVDVFAERLEKVFVKFRKKYGESSPTAEPVEGSTGNRLRD